MRSTSSAEQTARQLRQLLIESSPRIEAYTKELCPACTDLCCRQKHGQYRERDLAYLRALNEAPPQHAGSQAPESPCGFLGERGCVHPRWLRPFKCTWYFCEALLKALEERPAREARNLTAVMEEMILLYDRLEE